MFKRVDVAGAKPDGPTLGKFLDSVDTPAPMLRTYLGNPLFTTPDALDEEKNAYLGQLDVADLVFKDFDNIPLDKLYRQLPQVQHILSGRRSGQKFDSNCEASGMNVDSLSGRKQLTVQKYVERIKIDQPKVVIALADEVNTTLGKKRVTKAIDRTATWFQTLVTVSKAAGIEYTNNKGAAPFLFGVAQYNPTYTVQLPILLKHMLSQGARGIVIGNAYLGETEEQRGAAVTAIRAQLPADVPTLIQGADSLRQVLQSLALGVDIISTNYPQALSALGHAAAIDPALLVTPTGGNGAAGDQSNSSAMAEVGTKRGAEEASTTVNKKARTDPTDVSAEPAQGTSAASENSNSLSGQGYGSHGGTPTAARCEMNLWDVQYQRDTRPLVEGCRCHACRHHSRAYIHHLHICKEILAEVLLYHHNVHQVLRLFEAARHHLAQGPESFESWLQGVRAAL